MGGRMKNRVRESGFAPWAAGLHNLRTGHTLTRSMVLVFTLVIEDPQLALRHCEHRTRCSLLPLCKLVAGQVEPSCNERSFLLLAGMSSSHYSTSIRGLDR